MPSVRLSDTKVSAQHMAGPIEPTIKQLPPDTVIAQSRWRLVFDSLLKSQRALVSLGKRKSTSVARALVLQNLSRMDKDYLTITDQGETIVIGRRDENGIVANIHVHDRRVYSAIAMNGVLGAAEAYIEGYWSSPDLVKVVQFMVRNMNKLLAMNDRRPLLSRLAMALVQHINRNSVNGSKKNIASHYDLGNDFF